MTDAALTSEPPEPSLRLSLFFAYLWQKNREFLSKSSKSKC